jgi:class 3 adenylate cyclase
MTDLNEPLLALIGDVLDPENAEMAALDTAQIHFERRVGQGSNLPDREVALSLLWLAGTRVQLHKLRGARHTLAHMKTRFRGRFPDLEQLADFFEVRVLFEESELSKASEALDRLDVEASNSRTRKRLESFRGYMRGEILTAQGQTAGALKSLERALERLKGEPPHRVDLAFMAEIYASQGQALLKAGELEQAEACFNRSFTVATHIQFPLSMARSLRGRGQVFSRMGQLEKASEQLRESLRVSQEVRSAYGIIRSSISLGRAYYAAREYTNALLFFEEARVQCGEGRFPFEEAEVHSRIGDILVTEGRYSQAADFYETDLHIATSTGNLTSRAHALKNVGRIQRLLGNYERSEQSLEEARGLFSRLNDHQGLSTTLLQVVLSFVEQGKVTQAREAVESLKAASNRTGRPLEKGLEQMLEGMVMRREGRIKEAADELEASLAELSTVPGFYTVLCTLELAQLYEEWGVLDRCVHHYGEAVHLARQLRLHDMEKRSLDLLARVDRAEWARLLHHQTSASVEQNATGHVYVAVLLMDLRGTSSLMDRPADDVSRIVDLYFDQVNRAIKDTGGVLSRILGTRVMALFGLSGSCDPGDALRCARKAMDAVAAEQGHSVEEPLVGTAAAIATGEAISGLMGPIDRREHLILGGPIEVANDLLSATTTGEILVCPATMQAAGNQMAHPIPREITLSDNHRRIVAHVATTPALARRP